MTFEKSDNDEENYLYHRHVSKEGLIHIGIHPVLFGYRIRGGFTDDDTGYEIDWCAGANPVDIQLAYTLIIRILETRTEDYNAFRGIPMCSDIKPYMKDSKFLGDIMLLASANTTELELMMMPDLNSMRQIMMSKL